MGFTREELEIARHVSERQARSDLYNAAIRRVGQVIQNTVLDEFVSQIMCQERVGSKPPSVRLTSALVVSVYAPPKLDKLTEEQLRHYEFDAPVVMTRHGSTIHLDHGGNGIQHAVLVRGNGYWKVARPPVGFTAPTGRSAGFRSMGAGPSIDSRNR